MIKKYIKIFLVTLLISFFIYMSCSEENLENPSPYEETHLIAYSSSGCLRQYGDSVEVEIEVDSFDIKITQKNVIYNCCMDSIKVEFTQSEDTLKLTSVGFLTIPCDCDCTYEISTTIGISKPGIYLVAIFTKSGWLVYQEWVEVPQ
jgi:hypothetical protein